MRRAASPIIAAVTAPSLARLSEAEPEIYRTPNVERMLTQWREQPTPDEVATRMRWRDRRLAALKAHKRAQPRLGDPIGSADAGPRPLQPRIQDVAQSVAEQVDAEHGEEDAQPGKQRQPP